MLISFQSNIYACPGINIHWSSRDELGYLWSLHQLQTKWVQWYISYILLKLMTIGLTNSWPGMLFDMKYNLGYYLWVRCFQITFITIAHKSNTKRPFSWCASLELTFNGIDNILSNIRVEYNGRIYNKALAGSRDFLCHNVGLCYKGLKRLYVNHMPAHLTSSSLCCLFASIPKSV